MNALKSGIDAKSQIIRGEKAVNLETLKTEYHDRFHPTTPEQRMLVDTLIDAEWLLRRVRGCEAQLWEQGAGFAMKPSEEIEVAQAFRGNMEFFARLQSRIDRAHRIYRDALQDLRRRLQAEEEAALDLEAAPTPLGNQSVKPPKGFVPQPAAASPMDTPPPPPSPHDSDLTGPSGTAF